MEWKIEILPSAIKSLVQVCFPRSKGQNGIIHLFSAKSDQITGKSMCATEHSSEYNYTLSSNSLGQNDMILKDPSKCVQISA